MIWMKKVLCLAALAAFLTTLLLPVVVFAQEAPAAKKCEGPADMCAQIFELQKALDTQKALTGQKNAEKDTATAEKDKAKAETTTTVLKTEKKDAENVAKMIAFAAVLAIALKTLVSVLKSWKGFFTTDKQKAWLKISTLVIGFLAFLAANIGFGIPWWQSLILAGGGPGAIMVHELTKLIPVLLGKKKYVSESDAPPKPDPADPKPEDPKPPQDDPPKV